MIGILQVADFQFCHYIFRNFYTFFIEYFYWFNSLYICYVPLLCSLHMSWWLSLDMKPLVDPWSSCRFFHTHGIHIFVKLRKIQRNSANSRRFPCLLTYLNSSHHHCSLWSRVSEAWKKKKYQNMWIINYFPFDSHQRNTLKSVYQICAIIITDQPFICCWLRNLIIQSQECASSSPKVN